MQPVSRPGSLWVFHYPPQRISLGPERWLTCGSDLSESDRPCATGCSGRCRRRLREMLVGVTHTSAGLQVGRVELRHVGGTDGADAALGQDGTQPDAGHLLVQRSVRTMTPELRREVGKADALDPDHTADIPEKHDLLGVREGDFRFHGAPPLAPGRAGEPGERRLRSRQRLHEAPAQAY